MGNHHDSIALDWVRGEIQDTLTQSQQALEAFVDNRDDTARLRFCLNYLHQVHGTLQMVELYGAALLTEEMEKLTQAILNETVTNVDDAVEVLMQAILQLPQYLEHLSSSKDDFPLVLLPLLNDLRAGRGEALLSDTSLFKPDLSQARQSVPADVSQRLQDPKVLGHIRKLRQMFQFALAGVVRESDLAAHFDYMQKVIDRLVRLCHNTPRGELWKAAGAFLETLQSNDNPINPAVKSLLRELDAEIRRLIDERVDILQQAAPEALLKNLLYYVARARDLDTRRVQELREDYRLDKALPSDGDVDAAKTRVSGPGRDAIHSVVNVLNEELAKIKDQLDLFVRSDVRNNDELDELLPGLSQVANTLAVLGLGIPRKVVSEQIELVEKLSRQSDAVDDGTLMDIAGALLYIEASLAGLDSDRQRGNNSETESGTVNPGSRELSEASNALLRESRNTLEQVKSAIVNFIASQWETGEIEHVPGLLHSIRGGLALIPLDRVADMLASAERYVTDVLLGGKQIPDWKQLDTLADAVTSIEYYLERLADGIGENDSVLALAESSFLELGFPVGEEPTWKHPSKVEDLAAVNNEAPAESGSAPSKSSDHELLDDEILGIFIEEAEEVLETINEFYPRLRQSSDDREALTEVRRAYHTLKGSGRLVGATSIGELAWSVENLLNRVIDQTLKPTDEMFDLIDRANTRIPSLIREFRDGETAGDVQALIEQAERLSTTRKTDAHDASEETAHQQESAEQREPTAKGSPDDDLIDDEILEIFIEEAGEVLETIREYLPVLLRHHEDRTALSEVRRAFHTLKGSGRMVRANVVGELAWSVENMLNRVIDGTVFMNDDIAGLLDDVTASLPALVEDFEKQQAPSINTAPLEARANALANGEFPDTSAMPASEADQDNAEASEEDPDAAPVPQADGDEPVDPVLLEIFESETETHLQTLKNFLTAAGEKSSAAYTDDLSRALHTLKGSAHTAGIAPIATVITPLERFIKEARAQNKRADQDVIDLIGEVCGFLTRGLGQIAEAPQAELPGTREFLNKLDAVSTATLRSANDESDQGKAHTSPQLVQLFLSEGLDILLDADRILDDWAADPDQTEPRDTLRDELNRLTDGANDAELKDVAELTESIRQVYERTASNGISPDDDYFLIVRAAHEHLINMMDQVAAGLATEASEPLLEDLESLANDESTVPEPKPPSGFDEQFTDDLEEIDRSLDDEVGKGDDRRADAGHETPPLPETDEEMDDELAAIFLEEARDLIDSTSDSLQNWSENTGNTDLLRLLQRDLHTLKGGARLADIASIGDLSHELENLFEGLTENRLSVTDALSELLFRCHDRLAGMVDALEQQETPRPAPDLISEILAYMDSATGSRPVTDVRAQSDQTSEDQTPEELAPTDLSHLDPELLGIFLEEAYDLINSTGSLLHIWTEDPSNRGVAAELQRDVHTLKGGARMAGVDAIGDLTHVLEDLFEKVAEGQLDASEEMNDLLFACHDRLAQMVEEVATEKPCPPAKDLVRNVEAIIAGESLDAGVPQAASPATGDDLAGIFLDEGLEIHEAIGECLAQWREEPDELQGVTQLQQELHTLKGGARLSDVDPVAELAEAWSDALDPLIAGASNQSDLLELSGKAQTSLRGMLTSLEEGHKPTGDDELIRALEKVHDVINTAGSPEMAAAEPTEDEAVDAEVLEIFLEEAGEILDQLEQVLGDWHKEPSNLHFNQEAQRALHTLKGGARLSQLSGLGDKAHELETRLIDLGGNEPNEENWKAITADQDGIVELVNDIRQRFENSGTVAQAAAPAPETPTPEPEPQPKPAPRKPAPSKEPGAQATVQRAPQETIRVSAPLLDELVNLAGETSITRGRLESQTSDFSHNLDEMAATIDRLREQLRRMDIETETQILFRAEKEHGPDYGDDFDPLEMDRYSAIQQLSRALTESSSDLADLRETLSDRVRDTETLLVQQSRINTELQEGLMKTRMIPFSSMVPRLRRIVRQISGELAKKVEFDVRNAEGEMDRNILERMIAPLEHMLRNALDHGIEKPADRKKSGKPETGEVTLSLTREGGDVVLRMIDDGAGIPADIIRDKAIRQGMLGKDEELSNRDILQFILQPGFSTAQQVTQISGRGVGMDVVASEIKQLGGSLDIDSTVGKGTVFTVRLPFTVSVNRALMVSTGEDFYAIPLNTIEGIVRVSTYELEEYYKPEAPLYEYAGQEYRLQYLGSLLNSDHHPKLQGQALPLPVILVRGAEQPVALQVDSLMGSREIVVKSLGPQFGTVRGVSGATILGDGNVVVILDLPAMIRSDILSERQRLASLEDAREANRKPAQTTTVMVVDDSVTVRKVTSRLLERNGMEVITAKDGLDAVAQLQDHRPDIILLDIEMPRMDGFEVASFVRHDESLRDTPICMITSRTGEKHRERALAIGVNEYLGKPFQETELLDTISRLTGNH
jgi:chemosensory pili system protein ChpA (sensor histidine kinase/response regulator)